MSGRPAYTEAEKAKVYAVLRANDGNIKRTARDTNIPENTVRRWKVQFVDDPPALEHITEEVKNYVDHMERIRDLALVSLELELKQGNMKGRDLVNTIHILEDKITRARGLATSRQEHVLTLPSADELRATLSSAVQLAIEQADHRQHEIIDAEVVDVRMLPPGTIK